MYSILKGTGLRLRELDLSFHSKAVTKFLVKPLLDPSPPCHLLPNHPDPMHDAFELVGSGAFAALDVVGEQLGGEPMRWAGYFALKTGLCRKKSRIS